MIEVRGLSVGIAGRPVLSGVDLTLTPGTITGLVGESGSGKSMTALAIMGLLPPGAVATGRVLLDGTDLLGQPERVMAEVRGRRIGMVFQEPMTALNPLMTIGDQVAEVLRLHGLARGQEMAQARAALDRVGLPAPRFPMGLYPHQLSGGQRQRVAIAMAVVAEPDLLIADEPTTALDVTTQARILDLLRGLVAERGMALMLVTHDLAVVAGLADRVVVMKDGAVVETGPTEAVFRTQAHPYTRALFAAARHVPDRRAVATGAPVLRLRDVVRVHPGGVRAVDGVSFDIRAGESVGLVGASGCGKTTLARAILGLDPVQGGTIALDGREVSAGRRMPRDLRARMQAVFQDPFGSFNPRWKVAHLLAEPFHLTGRPRDWRARVAQGLAEVGLPEDSGNRYIHEFSGGQRQRLAIARALMIRPGLIVLDEAVSALDVRVRAQVLDLLADLQARHGVAFLFVSHDLGVVRGVTDRVLVMDHGRIVEEGETAAVMDAPRHEVTQGLMAAMPVIPEGWRVQ